MPRSTPTCPPTSPPGSGYSCCAVRRTLRCGQDSLAWNVPSASCCRCRGRTARCRGRSTPPDARRAGGSSPAPHPSTSASPVRRDSQTRWACRIQSGPRRGNVSPTRFAPRRTGSRTRGGGRWTGTTRFSAGWSPGPTPSSASPRAGTTSWCRSEAFAVYRTGPGSPPPRPANLHLRWCAAATSYAPWRCSIGRSIFAAMTQRTGRARTTPTVASSRPTSSPPGRQPRSCSLPTRSAAGASPRGLTPPADAREPAPEHAQAPLCGELMESFVQRAAVHVEGRLPAVVGVGEDVMDHQQPALIEVWGEAGVVGLGRLLRMAAIDEEERQRSAPVGGSLRRFAHHRDHPVLDPRFRLRTPEVGQRIDPAGARVQHGGVAVELAGLVLLRAAMVVDAEQQATMLTRRTPSWDRATRRQRLPGGASLPPRRA